MAKRPIFLPQPSTCLVSELEVEFEWFPGFSRQQKQNSIASLHKAGSEDREAKYLEVSTKSPEELGVSLSAFNLQISMDQYPNPVLLEAAFQGSKVFERSGQHKHLYQLTSGTEIKKFINGRPSEDIVCFKFEGHAWPLQPLTAFYDWLYLRALQQIEIADDGFLDKLAGFDGFTDIEFNPAKSINCQARSCALFVALSRAGIFREAMTDPQSFIEVLDDRGYGTSTKQGILFED